MLVVRRVCGCVVPREGENALEGLINNVNGSAVNASLNKTILKACRGDQACESYNSV